MERVVVVVGALSFEKGGRLSLVCAGGGDVLSLRASGDFEVLLLHLRPRQERLHREGRDHAVPARRLRRFGTPRRESVEIRDAQRISDFTKDGSIDEVRVCPVALQNTITIVQIGHGAGLSLPSGSHVACPKVPCGRSSTTSCRRTTSTATRAQSRASLARSQRTNSGKCTNGVRVRETLAPPTSGASRRKSVSRYIYI